MAIPITVPRLGWSMDEATFSQWLKKDGDIVEEGDSLFELESEKAVQEIESLDTGILRIIPDAPRSGETVKVGQTLGYLCEESELAPFDKNSRAENSERAGAAHNSATSSFHDNGPVASPSVRRLARELDVDLRELHVSDRSGRLTESDVRDCLSPAPPRFDRREARDHVSVSPRAARTAAELGVNLGQVQGRGRTGRIRERDVREAAAEMKFDELPLRDSKHATSHALESSDSVQDERLSDSNLRTSIAAKMLAATQNTAQVTLTAKADATNLISLRDQFRRNDGQGSSWMPGISELFVKLSAAVLELHPLLTHQWTERGIVVPNSLDIAVAVNTRHGLYAPILRDVPSLSLRRLSEQLRKLVERAHARQLSLDDLQGGIFTISNLGQYRVDAFTPIINVPQSAILGVGRIMRQPTVVGEQIAIRHIVTLSLTFDHRVVDGAPAAAFLTTMCECVENPALYALT